jgi:hypothetical protein
MEYETLYKNMASEQKDLLQKKNFQLFTEARYPGFFKWNRTENHLKNYNDYMNSKN